MFFLICQCLGQKLIFLSKIVQFWTLFAKSCKIVSKSSKSFRVAPKCPKLSYVQRWIVLLNQVQPPVLNTFLFMIIVAVFSLLLLVNLATHLIEYL